MSASNRRKHERVRAQGIAAHLQTQHGLAFCVVENIAAGGLFLRTQQLVPLGTAVTLRLARPDMKRPLKILAHVVSVVEPAAAAKLRVHAGMGLAFEPLRAADVTRLNELVRELSTLPPSKSTLSPSIASTSRNEPRSVARDTDQGLRPTMFSLDPSNRPTQPPRSRSELAKATRVNEPSGFGLTIRQDPARLIIQLRETRQTLSTFEKRLRKLERDKVELGLENQKLRKVLREQELMIARLVQQLERQ